MPDSDIDFGKLGEKARKHTEESSDRAHTRTAKVATTFGRRVLLNEEDPAAKAVEILLGLTPGTPDELAALLGFNPTASEENGTPELAATTGKQLVLHELDENGQPTGLAMKEQQALEGGYFIKLDGEGQPIGYQKPAKPVEAPSGDPPWNRNDKPETFPVFDKNGRQVSSVTLVVGNQDHNLDPIIDEINGKVTGFNERGRFSRTPRRP